MSTPNATSPGRQSVEPTEDSGSRSNQKPCSPPSVERQLSQSGQFMQTSTRRRRLPFFSDILRPPECIPRSGDDPKDNGHGNSPGEGILLSPGGPKSTSSRRQPKHDC